MKNPFAKRNEPKLVPIFIPSLAFTLAHQEEQKGSPLTQAECEAIRDKAPVIMMPVEQAAKYSETHGFVDIEPENVWVDWHRLRCHMLGGFTPRIVLCVPLPEGVSDQTIREVIDESIEVEVRPHQTGITTAFAKRSFAGIESHDKVAYLVGPNFTQPTAIDNCIKMAHAADRILDAGGLAVMCESSGAMNTASNFRALAKAMSTAPKGSYDWAWAALLAYSIFVVASNEEYYSCGMHLLGYPEIVMDRALADRRFNGSLQDVVDLLQSFGVYLVAGVRPGGYFSGATFSLSADGPAYRALWEPCTNYEEDDLFFNPFGRWKLEPRSTSSAAHS